MQNFSFDPCNRKLHRQVPNPEPSITQQFQPYHSTLNNPRSLNLSLVHPKTKPNSLNRHFKIRTKIPFVKNSTKINSQVPIMFFILSPLKPYKNRAKNHAKSSPKIENEFGRIFKKMQRKYALKEERERGGYLRRVLRSAR